MRLLVGSLVRAGAKSIIFICLSRAIDKPVRRSTDDPKQAEFVGEQGNPNPITANLIPLAGSRDLDEP